MARTQFTLRTLLAAVAAAAVALWLCRLSPPMLFTLAAFLVLIVLPVLLVGQPDVAKIITSYLAAILCFGGLCFFIAHLLWTYW